MIQNGCKLETFGDSRRRNAIKIRQVKKMKSGIGFMGLFLAAMAAGTVNGAMYQHAERSGIRRNGLGNFTAYGNPYDRTSWSQKVKAKRRAAQKKR